MRLSFHHPNLHLSFNVDAQCPMSLVFRVVRELDNQLRSAANCSMRYTYRAIQAPEPIDRLLAIMEAVFVAQQAEVARHKAKLIEEGAGSEVSHTGRQQRRRERHKNKNKMTQSRTQLTCYAPLLLDQLIAHADGRGSMRSNWSGLVESLVDARRMHESQSRAEMTAHSG